MTHCWVQLVSHKTELYLASHLSNHHHHNPDNDPALEIEFPAFYQHVGELQHSTAWQRHYSPDLMFSPAAKASVQLPDLAAIA
jgi:hypothetical protein